MLRSADSVYKIRDLKQGRFLTENDFGYFESTRLEPAGGIDSAVVHWRLAGFQSILSESGCHRVGRPAACSRVAVHKHKPRCCLCGGSGIPKPKPDHQPVADLVELVPMDDDSWQPKAIRSRNLGLSRRLVYAEPVL